MQGEKPWTELCTVVAMDTNSFCYRACSVCERALPETNTSNASSGPSSPLCRYCNYNAFNPGSTGCRRFYRILLSIATTDEVIVVICFDRAARSLFGCSADEFFNFCKANPFAVTTAAKILEGDMFRMTLSRSKGGNAQHLRVVSMVPLRSEFLPVIENLKMVYRTGKHSKKVNEVGASSKQK